MASSILLKSGTNELEVVEFYIDDIRYGVNVTKVEEICDIPEYRAMPQTSDKVLGFFNLRGKIIPLIDLPSILGAPIQEMDNPQIIVTHFNERIVGFVVERVVKIIRLSWSNMIPPPYAFKNHPVIGVIIEPGREDDLIQLIDFEKIMEDIVSVFKSIPAELQATSGVFGNLERSAQSIWIAEDSKMIQQRISVALEEAGYNKQRWFTNGAAVWEAVNQLNEASLSEALTLLVADIEMPQMDGLALTKRIKDHPLFKTIPVIVFSSLINEGTIHKCQEVGADTQVAKPDLDKLVLNMDKLIQQYAASK